MNESHLMSGIAGTMQFAVALYALWLNRRYGTSRVGWSLFWAFALLAMLQIVQATKALDGGFDAALKVSASYVLLSFLLLIGMVHLQTMLKERLRAERLEQQMRAELESEVKSKTAHLTRAIEELMSEVDRGKTMAAIIKSGDTRTSHRTADGFMEAALAPVRLTTSGSFAFDADILNRMMDGEWVAHF